MFKILLVEDELSIRQGLRVLIEQVIGGFEVIGESENGKEALSLLMDRIPDLVITDIRMKEMNGLEMIKHIRYQQPHIEILIISGYSDFEYAKLAIQYGVADYLLKPVNRVELSQFLSRFKNKKMQEFKDFDKSNVKDQQNSNERQLIRNVKELIEHQLDQNLSLKYVADQVYLNQQYLSTLFKTETGVNFSYYVKKRRIEKAKVFLKETDLKIYEIGRLCGYSSPKHFMSVFKKQTGFTPSLFRESSNQKN